jgi:CelD/BcsL family acetyltransferase involved in cellulose biosynthesis
MEASSQKSLGDDGTDPERTSAGTERTDQAENERKQRAEAYLNKTAEARFRKRFRTSEEAYEQMGKMNERR